MNDIVADASDVSPEPKAKAGITFRPNETLRQQIEAAAKECNQSTSKWLESHLENYFAGPRDNIFSIMTELREVVTMFKSPGAPKTSETTPRPIDPDSLVAEANAQARAGLQVATSKKTAHAPQSNAPTSSMVSPLSAASKKIH